MTPVATPQSAVDRAVRLQLARAARQAFDLDALPEVELATPRERGHGDLASPVAMQLARQLGQPPRAIAEALVRALEFDGTVVDRVEVAGPGFLNFHLASAWLQGQVGSILASAEHFGESGAAAGQKVQVEFVSANPTGPLNVVSARAAAVGDTLVRLLRASGAQVQAEFLVNDAGSQVDQLAASLEARWRISKGEVAELPDDGYHGDYVEELARGIAADHDPGALDPAPRLALFREQALERILAGQEADLGAFGVQFDRWFRESELHARGQLDETLAALRDAGHIAERDGAQWFVTTAFGDDADRVVVRSDGRPTYLLADIAYHRDKHARGYERVVDVWGPDHHGHIARMQAAAQALGYGADWLEILIVQQVNLLRGGQAVKMSKRRGDLVTLSELEAEVGRDPARFFFLMRKVGAHLDFDLELAKRQSEENPCFYVQYAHARLTSILERAAERDPAVAKVQQARLALLTAPAELDLIRELMALPTVVAESAAVREPQRMTTYLRGVAQAFHHFYQHQRVVGVDPELSAARLSLVRASRWVIRNGLALLGLDAPAHM